MTPRELYHSLARAQHFLRQKYQNKHTLLVALLGRLLLMAVVAGQGLVNGSHGDIRALWMCLRCAVAGTEKVREHLMPRNLAWKSCMGPRARTRHGREVHGSRFPSSSSRRFQLGTLWTMRVAAQRSRRQLFCAVASQFAQDESAGWSGAAQCWQMICRARGGSRCGRGGINRSRPRLTRTAGPGRGGSGSPRKQAH